MNESWMSILCWEKVYEYQKSVVHESKNESCSVLSNSLWPHGLYSPWNSPGQNTGVHCLSLLQGIFPTQGLNPGLPHCRQIYQLNHKGSPGIPELVAYPFSSGSSRFRNQTEVYCIAGGFFTSWATRETLKIPCEMPLVDQYSLYRSFMRRREGEKDRKFIQKSNGWDFSGGSVVKNPSVNAEDMDSNAGQGTKIPYVSE